MNKKDSYDKLKERGNELCDGCGKEVSKDEIVKHKPYKGMTHPQANTIEHDYCYDCYGGHREDDDPPMNIAG